ncbi:TetR/AcrR family transcriptional regulator [Mycobacterium paraterrae]|uniref:TetR/AcrR family transcriptional regulator n=1 Tax=Mycobacterium paraterrae TaxID=577492 RepID=A0ABY3VVH8_9MYCO|nr:TetR/AcrR family transcriptional regulator [Mycobacterium paraterrae]UMB71555.1 TetR/AcrR family transcriptional regulator [Mycobacterium paraterrae]
MNARDPDSRREHLLATALAVLDEFGPAEVTTRKLAKHAGMTTMAVYSEFGSMGGVVRAVVDAGFAELGRSFASLERTDDPICDMLLVGATYRALALSRPHLYSVMFGAAELGGYRRTGDELTQGIDTFQVGVDAVAEAMDHGLIKAGDAFLVTAQLWSALHGQLILENANMLDITDDPYRNVFLPLMKALIVGLGARPDTIATSVARALELLPPEHNSRFQRRDTTPSPVALYSPIDGDMPR